MEDALTKYLSAVNAHTAAYSSVQSLRKQLSALQEEFSKVDLQAKSIQLVGQTVGEILTVLENDRFVVRSSSGPRYVVGICQEALLQLNALKDKHQRVSLDTTTLTIMRVLPKEVNPLVFQMCAEDVESTFDDIGGLSNEIREFSEVIKRSIEDPHAFKRIGVLPPKGCLLYGPPGTGKTLLARCMASMLGCKFLKVVASSIIEKYIGESARLVREMFAYARENRPCVIFLDEIDAIGGKRVNDSSSSDREVQRTLMELLAQLDGFDSLDGVKVIMATNRPDILDEALLRPGRLDRKIEIPLPSDLGRKEIIKIHARKMDRNNILTDQALDLLSKLTIGFNGADLRNVCTEAGLCAIKNDRDEVIMEDFVKSARKIAAIKKLESQMDYKQV